MIHMKEFLGFACFSLFSVASAGIVRATPMEEAISSPDKMVATIKDTLPEINDATLRKILQDRKEASEELQALLRNSFIDGFFQATSDKSIKDVKFNLYKDGENFGQVNVESYHAVKDAASGGLEIVLNINTQKDRFSKYDWKQSIWTNYASTDGEVRAYIDPEIPDEPKGECIRPFYWTEKEHSVNPKRFSDAPSRPFSILPIKMTDGRTTNQLWWNAELSLYGINGATETRLLTLHYGFDLIKNGNNAYVKMDSLRQQSKTSLNFRRSLYQFLKKYGAKC